MYAPGPFEIEHIIPLSKKGTSKENNLAYACSGCNGFKNNKITTLDPVTQIDIRLFHPRQEDWNKHFIWSNDGLLIIPITSKARGTTKFFRLNRPEIVNIRRLLIMVGEHPPA